MKLYNIANIGLTDDNKWFITYYGNTVERGNNKSRYQVFFESLEDALNFMRGQMADYVLDNKQLVEKIKK